MICVNIDLLVHLSVKRIQGIYGRTTVVFTNLNLFFSSKYHSIIVKHNVMSFRQIFTAKPGIYDISLFDTHSNNTFCGSF